MNKSILILSSTGKCGIAQYTVNLCNALNRRGYHATIMDINTPDMFNIASRYNILLIEYENAIIARMDTLTDVCKELKKRTNTKIFVTPHSEKQHIEYFRGIDSFIYHKPNTLNVGVPINTVNMGVPCFDPVMTKQEYKTKYGIRNDSIVLSTVGFMFGWKRHSQFVELIAPTLKANPNMIVQLLTSHSGPNPSETMAQDRYIKASIDRHSLRKQVIHITDWVQQTELNERLYMSDLGFLYAGIESTSSSASLKEFVSSRLPVVRTCSNHFHDVVKGCVVTSKELNEFVRTVVSVSTNKALLDSLAQEMQENYNLMNYNIIVDKFIEIFEKVN